MYVGQKNPRFSYSMSNNGLQVVVTEKDLGVMISSDLKCSQQCNYAYKKAIRVMGMIRRMISYKEPKIMLSHRLPVRLHKVNHKVNHFFSERVVNRTRHWLGHMSSIARVLGTLTTGRTRNC